MKIIIKAKCDDRCSIWVPELGIARNGYVPRNMGIGGGDYISFTYDSETGKIEGWQSASAGLEDLKEKFEEELDEE